MKEKIIVLKVTKYSDHHLIVTGINLDGSKRSFMAPAALKSKKRFGGGVLEPTHFIDIQFSEPKSEGQMAVLKEAQIIEGFEGLRLDYDRLQAAFQILKYTEKIAQEELGGNEDLFRLLGHALKTLQSCKDPRSLVSHFEIKILYFMGVLELENSLRDVLARRFEDNVIIDEVTLSEEAFYKLGVSKREYLES